MILSFDTSGPHVAAALWDGQRSYARVEAMAKGQAERLMPLIQELLAEAGAGWPDLTRIAVGTGPGNFTGVRISVSAARGLALGLGIPAVGVSLFQTLGTRGEVVIPAPRGMVYVQRFEDNEPSGPVTLRPGETAAIDPESVVTAMARMAASRPLGPAPAPLYARPADAAPPSDPPPAILPG